MSEEKFKECPKHGWFSKSGFYSSTSKRTGRKKEATYYECKLCNKEYRNSKRGKNNRNRLRREWAKKHPERERAMSLAKYSKKRDLYKKNKNAYNQRRRLKVLQHYSNSDVPFCACCKESSLEFLALDHKNGDGGEHRRQLVKMHGVRKFTGSSMYTWVIKNNYPDMFRVLCHNCNSSYGSYGYCPHQKREVDKQQGD